jgi:hypothetical protein
VRRGLLRWAAIVLGVSLLPVGLSGCFPHEPMPELPETWEGAGGTGASITLRADGTGGFVNVPHGAGVGCPTADPMLLNGEFTWHQVHNGLFAAKIGDSQVSFGADGQGMGSLNWQKLVVVTCEGEDSLSSPVSVYLNFDY